MSDDIAKRAGLSKGAVYLYFNSKEYLFRDLMDSVARPRLELMREVAGSARDLEAAFRAIADIIPDVIRSSDLPRMAKVLIGDSQMFPEIVEDYRRKYIDQFIGVITDLFRRFHEAGQIDIVDPEISARLFVAPVIYSGIWQTVFYREVDGPDRLEDLFRVHVDNQLKAINYRRAA